MNERRAMNWDFDLTEAEGRIATWVGNQRYCECVENKRNPGLGSSALRLGPQNDIQGAHGECATARAVNLYWPAAIRMGGKDVGGLLQVRSIDDPTYSLVVKPKDCDDDPFVLALQLAPRKWRMCGWLFGGTVKRRYPLRTDRGDPAHYAPMSELDDMALLLDWIAWKRCNQADEHRDDGETWVRLGEVISGIVRKGVSDTWARLGEIAAGYVRTDLQT